MVLIYHSILLIFFYRSCTSLLDFPSDNIRGLQAFDIVGGYPSFFGAIYIHDARDNHIPKRIKQNSNRFVPFSTVSHFTVKGADCSNLTHINSNCEVICSISGPNCTMKQQTVSHYCAFFCTKISLNRSDLSENDSIIYQILQRSVSEATDEENLLKTATIFEKKTIGSYVFGDEVRTNGKLSLLRPDSSGLCTYLYNQPLKYKVNYAVNCRWHFHVEKGCNVDDLVKFFSNQINSTEVCDQTGDQCIVPILKNMTALSSDQKCDNYSVMSVRLVTQQGSILGMLIEFLPSPNKCRESYCLLATEISFQEITQKFLDKMQMSRYENSAGRFRCPSEIACPAEMFYFLNTSDLRAFSAQFLVFIPLLALLLLHVS